MAAAGRTSACAGIRPVVQDPEAQEIDGDRNGDGGAGDRNAHVRVSGGLVDGDRDPAPTAAAAAKIT